MAGYAFFIIIGTDKSNCHSPPGLNLVVLLTLISGTPYLVSRSEMTLRRVGRSSKVARCFHNYFMLDLRGRNAIQIPVFVQIPLFVHC